MRGFQYLIKPFSENAEQQTTINYIKTRYPNVLFTTGLLGIRLPAWAMWLLIALGYRIGTSDLLILEARKNYHGLLIELKCIEYTYIDEKGKKKKRYAGKPSDEQKEFMNLALQRGYKACVCIGSNEACKVIDEYFA